MKANLKSVRTENPFIVMRAKKRREKKTPPKNEDEKGTSEK